MTETPTLTKEEKQVLADTLYRLVGELNRAIRDARRHSMFVNLVPTQQPGPDGANEIVILASVYEHVDFKNPAVTPQPPPQQNG